MCFRFTLALGFSGRVLPSLPGQFSREESADTGSVGTSVHRVLPFNPEAQHSRFESYASIPRPDDPAGGLDRAAALARSRGTEPDADHAGPRSRSGAHAQSLAEGHSHSRSAKPGTGNHGEPATQPNSEL